jgi:hypothetical protein
VPLGSGCAEIATVVVKLAMMYLVSSLVLQMFHQSALAHLPELLQLEAYHLTQLV